MFFAHRAHVRSFFPAVLVVAAATLGIYSHRESAPAFIVAEGLWVVCDTWFQGWEATVDGSVAEILRVNGIHRGVRVPAGSHRVEMHYRPPSFRWGLVVSAVATISLLIVALAAHAERET